MKITDKMRLDFLGKGTQVVEVTCDSRKEFFVWDYATSHPTKKYFKTIRLAIDAAIRAGERNKI